MSHHPVRCSALDDVSGSSLLPGTYLGLLVGTGVGQDQEPSHSPSCPCIILQKGWCGKRVPFKEMLMGVNQKHYS